MKKAYHKSRVLYYLAIIPPFFVLCLHLDAASLYVATNGNSTYPYDTWGKAVTNIQWAVSAAANGDTVWISNGVYVLTNQITVISNISMIGTGGTVVVDGNNLNRCIDFSSATGTLANLFITRGSTNDDGGGVRLGSGIMRDCVFSNNICTNRGGGIYVSGTTLVQRCTFIENKAYKGGGLYAYCPTVSLIDHCLFYTNTAYYQAGGIYMYYPTSSIITGCDLICNVATNTGGGIISEVSEVSSATSLITHCTFVSNVALQADAGGLKLYYSYSLCSNCFFSNNVASNGGGGFLVSGGTVKKCVIARNISLNQTAGGGGGCQPKNFSLVDECIIEENQAGYHGGGVYLYSGSVLRNCLVRNNIATTGADGRGGGVCIASSVDIPMMMNCTIVSNYAKLHGGGTDNSIGGTYTARMENCIIYYNACDTAGQSNYYLGTASSNISYSNCCFAPTMGAAYTNYSANNIIADPLFVDRVSGNYRLSANSPCMNMGINQSWMTNAVDLDGRTRIRYGTVDMGAYETIYNGTIYRIP